MLVSLNVSRLCARLSLSLAAKRTMSAQAEGLPLPQVIKFLTSFAPLSLAESWDNVGLLVEPATPVPIKKALLTIDLTEAVMKEAVDVNANMIIAYHPPLFKPLKRITANSWKERLVATCLERQIAVFSPHTSWDAVSGGLSDWLASPFDFEAVEPLVPSAAVLDRKEFSHQATVFCPQARDSQCRSVFTASQAELLSTSPSESMTTYQAMVRPQFLTELQSGLNNAGCYYNIFKRKPVSPKGCGTGRFGQLKSPMKLSAAVDKIKALVGKPQIRIALEKGKTLESTVDSVALVAGSGSSVLRGVRAALYVTGEMLHHDLLEANHAGASVILLDHSDSERGYLSHFAPRLADHFGGRLSVVVSHADRDPITIV